MKTNSSMYFKHDLLFFAFDRHRKVKKRRKRRRKKKKRLRILNRRRKLLLILGACSWPVQNVVLETRVSREVSKKNHFLIPPCRKLGLILFSWHNIHHNETRKKNRACVTRHATRHTLQQEDSWGWFANRAVPVQVHFVTMATAWPLTFFSCVSQCLLRLDNVVVNNHFYCN